MNVWKYRSKKLLKAPFCHEKSNKKAGMLCTKLSSTSFSSDVSSSLKIISTFRTNKMVKTHTVNYHPSPSQTTSGDIPSHIFMDSYKGFISPESFLNFFLNLYIPPWLWKFQSYSVKIIAIHLWVKELNLFTFNHAPKQNSPPGFYHYSPGRWELPIPPEQRFLKIFFPEEKGGTGLWSWKNYQN